MTYSEGLFSDRSEAEHRALPLPSPSMLGRLAASPAKYLHDMAHPMESTPAMQFGTLVHSLALTGGAPEKWCRRPDGLDFRTTAGKDWRKNHLDWTVIDVEDWERAEAAAESISGHPVIARWLEARDVETAMVWTDPETGVQLKGKYDLRAHDPGIGWLVADLKVMASGPDYDAVQRAAWSYRYDRQLALYASGLEVLTGERHTAVLIACDPQPPHGCNVYPLSPTMQLRGLSDARDLLRVLAACQASGQWPADDRDIMPIGRELTPPRWAKYQEEEE